MAKRRRKAATVTRTKIVRVGSSPAPIIKVSSPRAPARRRRSVRRRRGIGGGGSVGGIISSETIQMAIGGALYGYAVKSGIVAKLPAIPVLGRTGTAAIILDYWSRHGGGQMAHRAARAAAAIAGYQLGHEGSIQGDDATTPGSLAGDGYAEGDEYVSADNE